MALALSAQVLRTAESESGSDDEERRVARLMAQGYVRAATREEWATDPLFSSADKAALVAVVLQHARVGKADPILLPGVGYSRLGILLCESHFYSAVCVSDRVVEVMSPENRNYFGGHATRSAAAAAAATLGDWWPRPEEQGPLSRCCAMDVQALFHASRSYDKKLSLIHI